MPGIKSPHDATRPPYNPAAASTELAWACAIAVARTSFASVARGLDLWSRILRAPLAPPWLLVARPSPATPGIGEEAKPPDAASGHETSAAAGATSAEPTAFATYRSAGGHAAAQVTVSD